MDTPWSSYNTTESARENWSVIADFVKNRKKYQVKKFTFTLSTPLLRVGRRGIELGNK